MSTLLASVADLAAPGSRMCFDFLHAGRGVGGAGTCSSVSCAHLVPTVVWVESHVAQPACRRAVWHCAGLRCNPAAASHCPAPSFFSRHRFLSCFVLPTDALEGASYVGYHACAEVWVGSERV